jgi:hypothetical protein
VALVGLKPIGRAPKSTVLWPIDIDDAADEACSLSRQYFSVYCNLNALAPYMLDVRPDEGRSVNDRMIARRTRLLIDVDAHDGDKAAARHQAEAIKAELGQPLIHSDSGNGYGLIYSIDLPNDEASKFRVSTFLRSLHDRYSCVDESVYTAGRLTRVIGTQNRDKLTKARITTCLLT